MIRIVFTKEEIEELHYQRFNHVHPRVQLKMEVLLLKAKGLKHKEICEIAGIHHNTLTSYLQEYIDGGIDALKELKFHKPQSELIEYRQSIEDEFRNNPPASIKEASARIKEMTGIQRSDVQVAKFLKKNRLKTKKSRTGSCQG